MATKDDVYTTIVKSQNKPNVVEWSKSMPSLTRRKRERENQHHKLVAGAKSAHTPSSSIPSALVAAQDVPAHHDHHHHQEKTYLGTRRLLESRPGLPEGSSDDGLRTGAHGCVVG